MNTPDNQDADPLAELDQELREKVGGEFRRLAEQDEYTARKAALRHRTLAQVAYELLSRGDRVRATIGAASFRGVVTHARGTLATLTLSEGSELHLNLAGPVTLDIVERSVTGGRTREQFGPETFVARLRELELAAVPIEALVGFGETRPAGVIEAVGEDHLMLLNDTTHFVPLAWLGGVRRLDL